MYTIKDIANEVGVSPTTVSLVLNKRPCRVSDETRKRIQDVAKAHNYAPNYSARALVTKQTRTLGLIMPDISNPYFSELAKGIEREAHKQGYFVIFCNSNDQGKKDVENLQLLLNRQVDGVVLVTSISDDEIPLANEFNALAARSLDRICATVQLSDTGIVPGSGVGNHRFALNAETLGVPVIAVGVPTVVDGATLALDILEEAGRDDLDPAALRGVGSSFLVTPRDIDQRVKDLAKVIGFGIDLALHPRLSVEDVELFLS